MLSRLNVAAGLVLLATLSGCGSSSSNPNFFTVQVDEGRLTGRYNTAGFTAAQVRDLLAGNCTGGSLSGYSQQPGEGGLVSFAATCKGGTTANGGTVEVERSGSQVVSQSLNVDANGDMSTSTRTTGL